MKNFVQNGDVMPLVAPYTVTSGQGFLVGSLVAVALADASSGANVEGVTRGIVGPIAKATGAAWTQGEVLYWDDSAKKFTGTSSSNTKAGCAAVAAASGDATGYVRLNGTV